LGNTLGGVTEGVSDTTKGVGDTVKGGTDSIGGKKQDAQNPLVKLRNVVEVEAYKKLKKLDE